MRNSPESDPDKEEVDWETMCSDLKVGSTFLASVLTFHAALELWVSNPPPWLIPMTRHIPFAWGGVVAEMQAAGFRDTEIGIFLFLIAGTLGTLSDRYIKLDRMRRA